MSKSTNEQILEVITRQYLDSHDFNGLPIQKLIGICEVNRKIIQEAVINLVDQELVGAIFSDAEINIHIIRTGFEPKEIQIGKLNAGNLNACLYPLPKHLESVVKKELYVEKPYELALALGEPQLSFRSFDLSVLEYYRNDPRYRYENDDIRGTITIKDEYYKTESVLERDQVLLNSFGFSYDKDLNRAVAVFIRYLANLSPEHQQIWHARELEGDYKLHPDYYRNTILGEWGRGISVFDAFITEIGLINKMCVVMGRPNLFRTDYGDYGESKPREFSFLIRPTLAEYNNFIHLLDKMLSEDINKKFFMKDIQPQREITRGDGKISVQNKGTIAMLDEWIRKYYKTKDWGYWDKAVESFKKIRKLRQKPAHSLNENEFDQKYIKEQREFIKQAYEGIHTLRLMLQNHPLVQAADIEIPDWLDKVEIWIQ